MLLETIVAAQIVCVGCQSPIPPQSQCLRSDQDGFAKAGLGARPRGPFEFGFSIDCLQNNLVIINDRRSGADQCVTRLQPTTNTVSFAHTHPVFSNDREAVGCQGRNIFDVREEGGFRGINRVNGDFSNADIDVVRSQRKTLYLRTPSIRFRACDAPSCSGSGRGI